MTIGGQQQLWVGVLGPLRLSVDGEPVEVRGTLRRAVLALLAIAQGRIVTVEALVESLWPRGAPESRQALHSHVSRLRGQLGSASARLQTRPDGYRLELAADELDLARARSLLSAARSAPDPATGYARSVRAMELFRGDMLADLCELLPIATAVAEWSHLRREVTDAMIDLGIASGRADEVVATAIAGLHADPLREPALRLAMRALAATGRPADALRRARDFRRALADETGLDPSAELDRLERAIASGAVGPAVTDGRSRSPSVPPVRVSAPPPTPLIGRESEIAAVDRLLDAGRMVTVTGPGGVGKTRLVRHLAQRRDGRIVYLAPVTHPAAIDHALAAALGLTVEHGDVRTACLALLGDAPDLLVIDNCEHQIDAARDLVDAILAACPRLTLLATSREPLGLPVETVFRLRPLPLPTAGLAPASVPSVALFVDRAARVRPELTFGPAELDAVAALVRRLDGMPLAIELAAGRLSTFALVDLCARLDRSLDLLGGPRLRGDDRHRTLRATVELSYQLLGSDEQRLFRQLAVFVDGVDLDTAEALAAELAAHRDPGEQLARLVDTSMIEVTFVGGTRYRMLETLRAYGLDQLAAAGERDDADERLLRWAVELVNWIDATMNSADEPDADRVLRREIGNLRAAWRLGRARGSWDALSRLTVALWTAVAFRNLIEIRGWVEELADEPAPAGHPRAAAVLGVAAECAYQRGDLELAQQRAHAGVELAGPGGCWQCHAVLAVVALARGHFEVARRESIAVTRTHDGPAEDMVVAALATAYAGDLSRARELNRAVLAAARSPSGRSWAHYVEAEIDSLDGRVSDAEANYRHAIELAQWSGATFLVGVAAVGLQSVRVAAGRITEALVGYRRVVDYFAATGNWTHLWTTLRNLADLLDRLDDPAPASLLRVAADRASDAPAVGHGANAADGSRSPDGTGDGATPARGAVGVPIGRDIVLRTAREAIDRHLVGG
jgi:predicted ATPase/DNA-binding SARP family transcriptional activator